MMSRADNGGGSQWDLVEGIGAACAISGAVESGLLLALTDDPQPAERLAAGLKLDPDPVRLVLDVLVAEGFARRTGDAYAASAPLRESLARMPRHGLLPFASLPAVLQGGARAVAMDTDVETQAAAYRETTPTLADVFADAARELAEHLGPSGRVLDLGCGAGGWSLALALADERTRVVGVDFEPVLAAMAARARAEGLRDRVELVAADLRGDDELPAGFDTVVLANVLRLEPPDVARGIVARAAACLAPDGRLVIVDALADETPAARRSLALYALHLSLRTTRGRVHPRGDVAAWLRDVGLSRVEVTGLTRGPAHLAALVARA